MQGRLAALALALNAYCASASDTGFVGKLVLEPANCQTSGMCTLGEDFGYLDPRGIGWQAKKGNKTDGASIPIWAQPLVGKPFEPGYIKAAIIHDHYCDRHVRPWKDTHRVFYDALISSGVDSQLAGVLYGAVYLGGSKWRQTIPGIGCPIGKICISNKQKPVPEGTEVYETDEGQLVIVRPDRYSTTEFATQFKELQGFIDRQPIQLTPEEIAEAADRMFPDTLFDSDFPYGMGGETETFDK
jgi:hypothetical protein